MSKLDLEQIIAQLNIIPFLEAQGVAFQKKTEKGWYADCPFCQGSKKLWIGIDGQKKGGWKCYKCGEKGNVITLYSKIHNCSNGEAVKAIKRFEGIEDDYRSNVVPIKANQTDVPINFFGAGQNGTSNGEGPSEVTARGAARPRDIYALLVEVAALTDAHREELRTRRGFTSETIERLKFRSGGEHMKAAIEKLRSVFADQDLKEAGILMEVNGILVYNQQLLEDRTLISYLDENGEVYHIRPHKLGFEGRPIELYCRYLLKDKPSEIVLTEGEFKAAALLQWGIPALAMPGISAFGGRHFDRLLELLKEFQVKKITVIFDNEIKDNPDFPNYKEKPKNRYDVELWAYLMAYKLSRAGFTARIARLPDEWRQEGKIDFDGALAQGHTREEILKIIDASFTYKEYLESLPEDARRIVQRKLSRHFTVVPIKREFNKYVARRSSGKGDKRETWEETISNFVLNIKSSFFTPDGVIRNVQLVNEYGEHSDTFALSPSDMAGLNEFKKFCFSKGNFVFEGNTQDLLNVWKLEFLRDIGDLIYMPDRIGYIEDRNLWLFGNMAIKDGKIYRPDNDGIIWIEGRGYKPQSLQIGVRGEAIEDAIPSLSEKPIDIVDVAQKLKQTIGGYEAYIGIGWVIATIFSNDIFKQYKCMPILFPHGKRESGKSTFMRWLMSFFGIETEGVGIAETTQNFIARSLSYYSSLGTWFDEYRNEYRIIQKDGFFRSAYNRQLSGKGTTTAFQARGFAVHASVAISGEELPKDNGLFTRLVPLQVSAYKRDRTWYEWFNRHAQEFSYLTLYLLLNHEKLKPKILANIAELKKALLQKDISDRTAENWAICAGCFDTVVLQDDEFIRWVEQACQEIKQSGEREHILNQFLSDLLVLIVRDEIDDDYITLEDNQLYIWLSGVYNIWAVHYRSKTGREPFDEHSIRKYLQDEPYYIKTDRVYFKNGRRRAIIIDTEKAPEVIQDIISELKVN